MNLKQLEWGGAITGLLGSALLASNSLVSGAGFLAFLASNLFWIRFALKSRLQAMLYMQLGFAITSLVGIYRWLV